MSRNQSCPFRDRAGDGHQLVVLGVVRLQLLWRALAVDTRESDDKVDRDYLYRDGVVSNRLVVACRFVPIGLVHFTDRTVLDVFLDHVRFPADGQSLQLLEHSILSEMVLVVMRGL